MKKNNSATKAILFFLLIPIIYIGFQLFTFENDSVYDTDTIIEYTVSDSIMVQGIVGRSETQISYGGDGILGYETQNSDRVASQNVVATAYNSHESAALSAYAGVVEDEIEILEKSNISGTHTDVAMLQAQMYSNANELLNTIYLNDFDDLYEDKQNLQLSVNKLNIVLKNNTDYTQRLQELMNFHASLTASINGSAITAPVSGYFVSGDESEQRVYTTQQLDEMSAQQLYDAAQTNAPQNSENNVGKLIETHIWSFYTSIPIEQVNKFKIGQSVNIYFDEVGTDSYKAEVVSIEEDENASLAKIVLQSNLINSDVLSIEHTNARIEFTQVSGLRIDKNAIRVKDAVDGIYVLRGNIVRFCNVNIIFEDENYYIASTNYVNGENEIRLFDEAIVGGMDLYDGKLL